MLTNEVAAGAAVNAQTLRYYERRGLLPEPDRAANGYRRYPPDAVRLVRFIKHAQRLGFTLDDVEELLHLAEGGPDNCESARAMASARIDDLDGRIGELQRVRNALSRLVDTCEKPPTERECPVLVALETAAGGGYAD